MKLGFRFLISIVGLTAISAATLAANVSDMVSVSGHVRTRLELSDNIAGLDAKYTHQILNRARLNLDVTPAKPLMVRITPEFTNTFGSVAAGDNTDPRFTAHEAWMSWMANDMFTIYAGRQVLSYGKERIVGKDDWGQAGNNFDAARVVINHGFGKTDFVWAKIAGRNGTLRNDHNLALLYNAFTPAGMAFLKAFDAYLAWSDDQGATAKSNFWLIGARAGGEAGMFIYDIELATEFGKVGGTKDQKGIMGDAMVGVKVVDKVNVALDLGYGNSEWTELYPSNHDQLGKADAITTRNNLLFLSIMADGKINDKWGAAAAGYFFMAAKDDAGKAGGMTLAGGKRPVGIEGDLGLSYWPEKNLAFEFGYDMFKGLSAVKPADKLVSKLYLQGTLSF